MYDFMLHALIDIEIKIVPLLIKLMNDVCPPCLTEKISRREVNIATLVRILCCKSNKMTLVFNQSNRPRDQKHIHIHTVF